MIELIDVKKKFENEDKFITNGVNLYLEKGISLCIIGFSGEGKSVLLKQIAGLIRPDFGSVFIDGIDITILDEEEMQTIHKKCGYVFQFAALLDSMTIFENVGLALIEKGESIEIVEKIVKESLKQVNLNEEILYKYPSEISGGMKKRVGLARTLVLNPSIILYDEPTSGLDPVNTKIIHELIRKVQLEKDITTIVISHDIEIFKYVDMIAFLYNGKIEYIGPADKIWETENKMIFNFINGMSIK
jgi:phospholipid/cholesterol/gamma-HCH transport system ATP-binding protein